MAADEIVERLRALGVPVEVHRPTLFLSLPGTASVTVKGATHRAKPMAMSVAYPDGLTEPIVYVPARYAQNADEMLPKGFVSDANIVVTGKIVVREGFGMPGKVEDFEQRGAFAMIAVNPGAKPHWGICTTVWGAPDLRDLLRKPKIAVVAVNNPDGRILIAHAASGGSITLHAEVTEGWLESPISVLTIPGTDEPECFVLPHGHSDSWDVGIGDNAVGDATMLEIARMLWTHRDHLKRSVRIAWWPGHSTACGIRAPVSGHRVEKAHTILHRAVKAGDFRIRRCNQKVFVRRVRAKRMASSTECPLSLHRALNCTEDQLRQELRRGQIGGRVLHLGQ